MTATTGHGDHDDRSPRPPRPVMVTTELRSELLPELPTPAPATPSRRGKREKDGGSSWSTRACDLWLRRFPGSAVPGGAIGKALKPLVTAHGEDEVLTRFAFFLASPKSEYGAPYFATRYSEWTPDAPASGSRGNGYVNDLERPRFDPDSPILRGAA
jgi:hypothetical protein